MGQQQERIMKGLYDFRNKNKSEKSKLAKEIYNEYSGKKHILRNTAGISLVGLILGGFGVKELSKKVWTYFYPPSIKRYTAVAMLFTTMVGIKNCGVIMQRSEDMIIDAKTRMVISAEYDKKMGVLEGKVEKLTDEKNQAQKDYQRKISELNTLLKGYQGINEIVNQVKQEKNEEQVKYEKTISTLNQSLSQYKSLDEQLKKISVSSKQKDLQYSKNLRALQKEVGNYKNQSRENREYRNSSLENNDFKEEYTGREIIFTIDSEEVTSNGQIVYHSKEPIIYVQSEEYYIKGEDGVRVKASFDSKGDVHLLGKRNDGSTYVTEVVNFYKQRDRFVEVKLNDDRTTN